MNRQQAVALLREISDAINDTIIIDSVSLMPDQNHAFTADGGEACVRIRLQTNSNLEAHEMLNAILKRHGAHMTKTGNCLIIYKPNYTDSA